jgi:hypothetical protein
MSSPHLSSSSRGRRTGRGPNAGEGVVIKEKGRFELAETVAGGGFFKEQLGSTLLQSAVGGEIRCGRFRYGTDLDVVSTETDLQGQQSAVARWSRAANGRP